MKTKLAPMSRLIDEHPTWLGYATVTGRAEKWFFLSTDSMGFQRAVRAESCLVEPECGDTVLMCSGGALCADTASYIVAVLMRADAGRAKLVLPGGVAIHTEGEELQVHAEDIRLCAADSVTFQAPRIAMQGVSGELSFHRLTASIREVRARFGILNAMAQTVTSTVGRLVQKTRDSFRWTQNVDETRAGRMRLHVEERLHISAQHATVLAEGQVKIDGKKIDLG